MIQDQKFLLQEASKLAKDGESYDHLLSHFDPEYFLRFRIFIQSLPESIACKSIFGKAHWREQSEARKRKLSK